MGQTAVPYPEGVRSRAEAHKCIGEVPGSGGRPALPE